MGLNKKKSNFDSTGSYSAGFYDKIVFSKVKEGFGGRVRMMITGSAPIKSDVFKFMKIIMFCPFFEGYGQTENTAAAFITSTIDPKVGHVGGVVVIILLNIVELRIQIIRYSRNALYKR